MGLLLSCGSPKTPADLTLSTSPKTIDGLGQASTIGVTAFDESGMPGTGAVALSSMAGSLKTPAMVSLDVNGYGEVVFDCVTADDAMCTGNVQVKADWTRSGKETITAYADLIVGSGAGGGAGGGISGGGAGGGGGGGAGSHRPCNTGEVPGLNVQCCQAPPIAGPPCGMTWTKMGNGNNMVMMEFAGPNGNVMLPVVFTVGTHYADANACDSFSSGWQVDASSLGDNTKYAIQSNDDEGYIQADGTWVVTYSMVEQSYGAQDHSVCAGEFPASGSQGIGDFRVTQPQPPPNGFRLQNGDNYSLTSASGGSGFYYVNVR